MNTSFKALKYLTLLGFLLFLANCSKDDDPTPSDMIVGNWTISTVDLTIKVGSQSLVDYLIAQGLTSSEAQLYATQISDDFKDTAGNLDIKKGGTYSTTSGGYTDTGTWELTSDGKTLTLDKGTADESVFTVTALSSTNLNLTGDLTDTDSGLTLTMHLEIALTK
ncbi:MAG: hypothetical protein AABY93_03610 [Bacteroidota bacterium]